MEVDADVYRAEPDWIIPEQQKKKEENQEEEEAMRGSCSVMCSHPPTHPPTRPPTDALLPDVEKVDGALMADANGAKRRHSEIALLPLPPPPPPPLPLPPGSVSGENGLRSKRAESIPAPIQSDWIQLDRSAGAARQRAPPRQRRLVDLSPGAMRWPRTTRPSLALNNNHQVNPPDSS